MSVLQRERIATRPVKPRRFGPPAWILTVVVVGAVVAAGVYAATYDRGEPETAGAAAGILPSGELLFTADEIALMQLAERGYIPRQAVDWELMELKRLATSGVIPAEAVQPVPGDAVKRLVARGLVPAEAAP